MAAKVLDRRRLKEYVWPGILFQRCTLGSAQMAQEL
jgi:hypothetical protein